MSKSGMVNFFYEFMETVSNSGTRSYLYTTYGKDYEYFIRVWGDKLLKRI